MHVGRLKNLKLSYSSPAALALGAYPRASQNLGHFEAGPIYPVITDRFEFFKGQNARNKKINGVNNFKIFSQREIYGRYRSGLQTATVM